MEEVSVTGWEGGNNHWFGVAWGRWWESSWVRLFWSYSSKRQFTRGVIGRSQSLLKHSYLTFLKKCSLDLPELDGPPRDCWKTHHPPLFFSQKSCKHIINELSMVACLAAENSLERSLSTMLPFPVHLQLSLTYIQQFHRAVSGACTYSRQHKDQWRFFFFFLDCKAPAPNKHRSLLSVIE